MRCSYFKNVYAKESQYSRDIFFFLERIRKGKSAELITEIRRLLDKKARTKLKVKLPAITFNGTFTSHSAIGLKKASGLTILDFDHIGEIAKAKELLTQDNYVFAVWVSPSGDGLKVLVRIPKIINADEYKPYNQGAYKHFDFLAKYADDSTSDISRLCLESYDSEIYVNENSLIFTDRIEPTPPEKIVKNTVNTPLTSDNEIVNNLMVWFKKRYTGQNRNTNLHALARQFNCFGISESLCISYLLPYAQRDFNENEIKSLIKSAYKYTVEHNTAKFEDSKSVKKIKKLVQANIPTAKIKEALPNMPTKLMENEIERQKENINDNEFWAIDEKGKVHLLPFRFKLYLENLNIFKYYPSDLDSFIFIQKQGKFINEITKEKIKDIVLTDLAERLEIDVWDMMGKNTRYFTKEFLSFIETANIEVSKDTKNYALIYYRNKVVKVLKDKFELIDYENIRGFIWQEQVINRDIELKPESNGEFKRFIWLVSGENVERYYTIKSIIGYLLHSFKSKANTKAIIFNDEMISDTPNGGSGKGLIHYGLAQIKKVSTIDGKTFDSQKTFAFQTVSTDSQILVFDDVKKGFDFESLFSKITESLEIERKGKAPIVLNFDDSPKISITTNYTVKSQGGSFYRRMFEVELSTYFNSKYTPIDEFKHMLFDEWPKSEWIEFDNYMLRAVQFFLKNGLKEYTRINLDLRKLISDTNKDFIEFMDAQKLNKETRYYKQDLKHLFTDDYEDYKNQRWFTANLFSRWVVKYCDYKGFELTKGKSNGQRFITINGGGTDEVIEKMPF